VAQAASQNKAEQNCKDEKDYWKPRFPIDEMPVFKPEQAPDSMPDNSKHETGEASKESVMKKICEVFRTGSGREKSPGILKGGRAMFRKLVNMAMLAMLLVAASSLVKPVYAQSSCEAYIVLTCTVTLSVSITGSTTSFMLGSVAAGTTVYSTNGVTFRNDSQGAICTWALNVDPATLNQWTLANTPGLNQVAIYGVFQSTQNYANYTTVFSTSPQTYNASTGVFSCGSYSSPQAGVLSESRITPAALNGVGNYSSDRSLWIKLLAPLAVTTPSQSIGIVVTAAMAG
jgi:hypothetical protein